MGGVRGGCRILRHLQPPPPAPPTKGGESPLRSNEVASVSEISATAPSTKGRLPGKSLRKEGSGRGCFLFFLLVFPVYFFKGFELVPEPADLPFTPFEFCAKALDLPFLGLQCAPVTGPAVRRISWNFSGLLEGRIVLFRLKRREPRNERRKHPRVLALEPRARLAAPVFPGGHRFRVFFGGVGQNESRRRQAQKGHCGRFRASERLRPASRNNSRPLPVIPFFECAKTSFQVCCSAGPKPGLAARDYCRRLEAHAHRLKTRASAQPISRMYSKYVFSPP